MGIGEIITAQMRDANANKTRCKKCGGTTYANKNRVDNKTERYCSNYECPDSFYQKVIMA